MSRTRLPLLVAALLGAASGCSFEPRTPPLQHELNRAAIDANPDLAADVLAQDHLRGALDMLFGTPRNPGYLRLEDWVDEGYDPNWPRTEAEYEAIAADNEARYADEITAIREGRLDDVRAPLYATYLARRIEDARAGDLSADELVDEFVNYYPSLAESAEMYRQQCMHCHGVSGGGNGSTAPYLTPRPRDYRKGIFKYTALKNKARPRHEDVYNTLVRGIYLTAMPSFRRFSDAQLRGLADYVELLSKRGETEILLITDYDPDVGLGSLEHVQETYAFVQDRWRGVEENLITYEGEVPPSTPERIADGQILFLGAQGAGANCASCHGADGRGNGPSAKEADPETGELRWVKDDWGNEIQPRDLTRGVFRFGRRPIDLYRRIYAGINGTPMPEHFGMQITELDGTQRPLDENDLWNLVHFVRSLSTQPLEIAHGGAAPAHGGGGGGAGGGHGAR